MDTLCTEVTVDKIDIAVRQPPRHVRDTYGTGGCAWRMRGSAILLHFASVCFAQGFTTVERYSVLVSVILGRLSRPHNPPTS
jgi:hypothetical protein